MAYYKDLSYLTSQDGKQIAPGKLIRASRMSKLKLRELEVKKVIDLRSKLETGMFPEKYDPHIEYHNIPVFDSRVLGITYERNRLLNEINDINTVEETYREMVTNPVYVHNFELIIKEIVNSDIFPIVYHCSQGKDRTGITTYLLLSILGFDEETIIQDYMSIQDFNKAKMLLSFAGIMITNRNIETAKKFSRFMTVKEDYITSTIDAINQTYGNVDNFIREGLHLSGSEIVSFKQRVLAKK